MSPITRKSKWSDKMEPVELKSGHKLICADFPVLPYIGKILVEALPPEEYTKGGIVVPGTSDEAQMQAARVLAVCAPYRTANGEMYQPALDPGRVIYHQRFSGRKLELDGDEFLLLSDGEIIGVENAQAGKGK